VPFGTREFFRGQMFASWGFWNRQNHDYADVVFFTGYLESSVFVGLGGSAYNTAERQADRMVDFSNSGIQQLMRFLEERTGLPAGGSNCYWTLPGAWYAEAWEADYNSPLLPEPIEFVAARLADSDDPDDHGNNDGPRTIIGSPIFVARTGPTTPRAVREYERLRLPYLRLTSPPPSRRILRSSPWPRVGMPSYPLLAPPVPPGQTERPSP
jgi:hypothetical protein